MLKRTVSISLICLASCACTREEDRRDIERYIIESERQWAESVATGDTSVLERILAEDFIGVDPKGRFYDKAKMLSERREAPKYFVSNRLNEVKVRFYGNTAVAQGDETWERRSGEPLRGRLFGQTLGFDATASGRS
jgi:Domain of unknown function (DUF4440)